MPALAVCLIALLALPLHGQDPQITLQILQGEGEITGVGERVKVPPAIRVQDAQGRPLAEASVLFSLPTEGVTGDFGKGSRSFSALTDKSGVAMARNLRVADVAGPLEIYITVSYQGLSLTSTVTQHVSATPGAKPSGSASSKKLLWILLAVGGAGAGAAVALSQGGKSSAPPASVAATPPPITISVGSSTIGPPK